jgi:hypothetical protein
MASRDPRVAWSLEWMVEAETEPTRERRIARGVEWLADGKSRNWKYEKPR